LEAVNAPATEEGVGCEEVHGVDFAEHEVDVFADGLGEVDGGGDDLIAAAEGKRGSGIDGPEGTSAKAGQGTVAILGVGANAAALPEAELLRVHIEEGIHATSEVPVVVAVTGEEALVELGGVEIEAEAVLSELGAEAAPVAGETIGVGFFCCRCGLCTGRRCLERLSGVQGQVAGAEEGEGNRGFHDRVNPGA
jgi:hypothetical protein